MTDQRLALGMTPKPGPNRTRLTSATAFALPPERTWEADALCRQTGPDDTMWFPEKGGSTRDAKRLCLMCEVRAECLEWALDHHERHGIWGGMSERERRAVEQKRRKGAAA